MTKLNEADIIFDLWVPIAPENSNKVSLTCDLLFLTLLNVLWYSCSRCVKYFPYSCLLGRHPSFHVAVLIFNSCVKTMAVMHF